MLSLSCAEKGYSMILAMQESRTPLTARADDTVYTQPSLCPLWHLQPQAGGHFVESACDAHPVGLSRGLDSRDTRGDGQRVKEPEAMIVRSCIFVCASITFAFPKGLFALFW